MTDTTDATRSRGPVVALLGTGIMGAGMARNIARTGMPLRVWNRTVEKARPLAGDGIEVAETVDDAVAGADLVVTMLWDAASVEEALRQGVGSFEAGAVLVQMSTVGVDGADHLAEVAADLGLTYVDAPVLGTKGPAEQGTLTVLASGPAEGLAAASPVFEAVGARTVQVGEAGAGSRLKLAANAFVVTLLGGIAQSLALARGFGVDPQSFLDAVAGGGMDSPYVQMKGRAMLAGDFTPSFALSGALKDSDLVAAAAAAAGVDTTLIDAIRDQQRPVIDAGYGDEDMAAVFRVYGGL